jgi:micrococcal nuclease
MRSALTVLVFAAASPALADPCKAIPDRGPPPLWARAGYTITGTVRHVGDGDSICVSPSTDPQTWVEIRLADFYAPELSEPGGKAARDAMVRITRGRQVTCTATRADGGRVVSYDRLIASCRIGGTGLGDLMHRAGIQEGGRGR